MVSPTNKHSRSELPPEVLIQIEAVSDEFKKAWRAGDKPAIEDFLSRFEASARTEAFRQLCAIELKLRQEQGERPTEKEYGERFAEFTGLVGDVFDQAVAPAADSSLQSTAARQEDTDSKSAVIPSAATLPGVAAESSDKRPPTTASDSDLPGTLGRFEIRALLGEGAFGRVYRAYDPQLDCDVALKVPGQALFASGMSQETFLNEARNAAKLRKHPGVVEIYDVAQADEQVFIVSPASKNSQRQA